MEIKSLRSTPHEDIVESLLRCFQGYFVKLPEDPSYWESRFLGARIDYDLSFGMFHESRLIGFALHGLDVRDNETVAFNSGTGVEAEFRGQGIVDQLYAHALPAFRKKGVNRVELEVIQENARAIHVYERIGFKITRDLKSYKGRLGNDTKDTTIQEIFLSDYPFEADDHYAWDNKNAAIRLLKPQLKAYKVSDASGECELGYFIIDPKAKSIKQIQSTSWNYNNVFKGIRLLTTKCSIMNIDSVLTDRTVAFNASGLENYINQYEMEWVLG